MAGSNIDRRMSRELRERRAYQTLMASGGLAVAFVISTILWVVGAVNDHPAIVLFVLTVICLARFRMLVGGKPRRPGTNLRP